jgi:hypothetical protein
MELNNMASIALPLFQDLENTASAAVARVDCARKQTHTAQRWLAGFLCAPALPGLALMPRNLRVAINLLNSPEVDLLSEEELRQVAHRVQQLHGKLRKLVVLSQDLGLSHIPIYHHLLAQVEQRTDHLGSIAEGLYMSLNDDFQTMLTDAAEELRATRSASRGSLIEQM